VSDRGAELKEKRKMKRVALERYLMGRTHVRTGLAVAAALAIALAACTGARAQERPDDVAFPVEDKTQDSQSHSSQWITTSDPLVVTGSRSEPWADFRRTVADAAIPSCFSSDAPSHEAFSAEGLLRVPFLLHEAANNACR
jgi:hypothetical protein